MGDFVAKLAGRQVLVVEDDYFIACDLVRILGENGAMVVGPVSGLKDALRLIGEAERLDAALLDINLGGQTVFPVADVLSMCRVPFVFVTGYGEGSIPSRYARIPRCDKPVQAAAVTDALLA